MYSRNMNTTASVSPSSVYQSSSAAGDVLLRALDVAAARKSAEEALAGDFGQEVDANSLTIAPTGDSYSFRVVNAFRMAGVRYTPGSWITFNLHGEVFTDSTVAH